MYPYLLPNPKHTYPQSILSPQHMRAINGLRKNKEIVIKKIEPQKELKPDYIETLQYNIQEEQKVKEDTRSAEG